MDTTVGMIGLGKMGGAMAANLVAAGFPVVGFDPNRERLRELVENGGEGGSSPSEVAKRAEIVISSLPSGAALDEVINGEAGLRAAGACELILIECSTLSVAAKEDAREAMHAEGMTMLDCPLSGTGAQAVGKDLSVYGSGDRAAFDRCVPVLEGFSRSHHYLGDFGNGTRMKLVANLIVAIHNVATAEALVLGMKAGLDPATVYEVVKDGAGSSRIFELRGPMMVQGSYEPASMSMELWRKDMRLIDEFAEALECPTPMFATSAALYRAALADGRGTEDTAAVCAVLEEMAGVRRRG